MSREWDKLEVPLTPWIREAVATMGFQQMTPVQSSTIPLFMKHKDVVVEAVTGSGKTLAFLLPLIERLIQRDEPFSRHHIGALVICPTRELAIQIQTVFTSILALSVPERDEPELLMDEHGQVDEDTVQEPEPEPVLISQLLIGGRTSVQQDLVAFNASSPHVLIGTPGRINDFFNTSRVVKTKELEVLIMDEADRLLDMGFHDTLASIINKLPKQRRTGLFSATMTDAVSQLVRTGLRNPVKIIVKVKAHLGDDKRTPTSLQMGYMVLHPAEKIAQLIRVLHYSLAVDNLTKSIVYLPTCAAVDYFTPLLSQLSQLKAFTLIPLHGKQAPSIRQKHFKRFISLGSGTPSVLLTTDLAARGLDIPDVDLVIQLDPPQDPSAFSHRCGRAGRAGRPGKAVLFLNWGREEEYVEFLQVRKTPVLPLPRLTPDNQVDASMSDTVDEGCKTLNERLKQIVRKDRDLYERGIKAFVSYIRFYTKHQAAYIFRLADLDLAGCAASYGLLRLPSMPELKAQDVVYEGERVDMRTFAYADKIRETARLEALTKADAEHARKVEAGEVAVKRKPKVEAPAWSNKMDAVARKEARRDKKKRKRDAESATNAAALPVAAKTVDSSDSEAEADWKELRREKKMRNAAKRIERETDEQQGEGEDEGESGSEGGRDMVVSGGMFADL
ncbi:P-loop containing nucleoside triphosphate hydrolase protein [Protomyces lactucae-debilis]|uniref:ATP-dependent RNA helicase n=1 Tax=Protomyces lactucae-debilis TaxID=2754530 RepID=A0A1Y2F390_PROLT|nr:P-loop containing nucleoside triphosphate hydrolase protein [Protomyces lactucae-debilis]ORY77796.1 P-loop containing nucleoside triphosphate hydrolase protein [Protomyces lactucae-debilis]